MMVAIYVVWLLYTSVAAIAVRDEEFDPRGPCGPCFVDASGVSVLYRVMKTLTFTGYTQDTTTFNFTEEPITREGLYSSSQCGTTTVRLDRAVVRSEPLNDANFQRDAFTTAVGEDYFFVVSSAIATVSSTDIINATGTQLPPPSVYLAVTSVDVYPEAEGSRGADGKVTCQPRTRYPVLLETPIFVSEAYKDYGTVTSYGPQSMPTALVQFLQASASLLQRFPELSNCGTGVIQGAPYAIVPITGQDATETTKPCITDNDGTTVTLFPTLGPKGTKGGGRSLVPGNTGVYVPPSARQFAAQNVLPSQTPAPQNIPIQTPNPQGESRPAPAAPVVDNTSPEAQPPSNQQPGSTVPGGTTQVVVPAGASVADVGSPAIITLSSETVTGVVVSTEGSVVVLSVPTTSPAEVSGPAAAPLQFVGTASKKNGVLISLVTGLALVVGVFGRL